MVTFRFWYKSLPVSSSDLPRKRWSKRKKKKKKRKGSHRSHRLIMDYSDPDFWWIKGRANRLSINLECSGERGTVDDDGEGGHRVCRQWLDFATRKMEILEKFQDGSGPNSSDRTLKFYSSLEFLSFPPPCIFIIIFFLFPSSFYYFSSSFLLETSLFLRQFHVPNSPIVEYNEMFESCNSEGRHSPSLRKIIQFLYFTLFNELMSLFIWIFAHVRKARSFCFGVTFTRELFTSCDTWFVPVRDKHCV